MTSVATLLNRLVQAAHDYATTEGYTDRVLAYHRLQRARGDLSDKLLGYGIDASGALPDPEPSQVVLDLQHRLEHERERADRAEARASVAGWSA